jgi:hypothetical protein
MTTTIQINPEQLVIDWVSATAFTPVNKVAMRKLGHKSAILLSEMINQYKRWKAQGKLQNNSFYWTIKDCEIETALNRDSQDRECKKLSKLGLITCEPRYIDNNKRVRFFELNFEEIVKVLFENVEETKEAIQKKHADLAIKNKKYRVKRDKKVKSQNATPEKSQNATPEKSQNAHKVITKDLNKNKKINKKELENLSIYEEIENLDITLPVKKVLFNQIDRLNSSYLSVVELKFNAYSDQVDPHKFADILTTVLSKDIKSSFSNYLDRALSTYIENRAKYATGPSKPVRTEKLPEGYDQPDESGLDYSAMTKKELMNSKEVFDMLKRDLPIELKDALEKLGIEDE